MHAPSLARTSLVVLLLAPSLALAEAPASPGSPPAEAREELRDVAITLAPGNLVLGTLKVNGEFRLRDRLGLQVSLGAGKLGEVSVGEAGGQIRWYALGNFDHGLQLGLEVMYLDFQAPFDDLDKYGVPVELEADISATATGPFLGYKVAFDGGFTLEAQLGLQYYAVEVAANVDLSELDEKLDGVSARLAKEGSLVLPLANLNLGWSF
jgi:hypothetical protein